MKILKRFGPGLLALLALVVALDVARLAGLRHAPSFASWPRRMKSPW